MNNDWSSLSMRERAEYIKDAVSRGLHTVDSIRNEYKDGGKKKRTALDIQAANKQVFLKSLEQALKGNTRYSSAGWRKYLTDLALLESGYLAGITNSIGAKGYFLLMPSNRASSWSSPTLLFEEMFKMTDSNIQYLKKNMTKADLAKALALGIDIYGLVAGAHLGGAKGALNALRGVRNSKDMNGTSVMKYMKLFSQSTPKLTEADYQSNYSTSDLNRNRIVMLPHVEPVDNTYVAPIEPRYSVNPTLLPQGEAEGIQTSFMSLVMLELESPKMLLVEEPEVKSSPLTYILKVSRSSVPVIKTQAPNKVTTASDLYKKYYDVSSPTLLLLNLEEAIYRSNNNEFGNGGLKGNLYGGDNPNGQLMMTVGSIGYMPKIYAEKPDAIHVQKPNPPIFIEPDVSNAAALERQRRVYSNYDEALDNPLNPVQKVIYNGLRYLKDNVYEGIPSGVSNCTLTATQWVNPASPIKLASSIVNDPGKYNYSKISKEDALPGNLVIAKVPNLDSYHTMMLSGFADKDSTYTFDGKKYKVTKGEPLVTYSRGGHDNSFIRRNVPLSVYTSNSDGHTENLFYRYNSPNEVFLPDIVVTAKKGNKRVLGGNLFDDGGSYSYTKPLDNVIVDEYGNLLDPNVPSAGGSIRTPDVVITANPLDVGRGKARRMLENAFIESNDATATPYTTNSHLNERGIEGAAKAAAWMQDNPTLNNVGMALGAVPFAVAGYPAFMTAGEGAATALANPYVDAALTSYFGAHGLQKLANGEADWTTALEIAPLGRLAKPMLNEAALIVENYKYPLGRPQVPEGFGSTSTFTFGDLGDKAGYYTHVGTPKNKIWVSKDRVWPELSELGENSRGVPVYQIDTKAYDAKFGEPTLVDYEGNSLGIPISKGSWEESASIFKGFPQAIISKEQMMQVPYTKTTRNPVTGLWERELYQPEKTIFPEETPAADWPVSGATPQITAENAATVQRQIGKTVQPGLLEETANAVEKGRNTLLNWIRSPFYKARLENEPLYRVADDVVADAGKMIEEVPVDISKTKLELDPSGRINGVTKTRPAIQTQFPDGTTIVDLNTGLDVNVASDLGKDADETTLHELLHYMTANSKGTPISKAGEKIIEKGWMNPTETHFDAINIIHKNRSKGWQDYILDQNDSLLPQYDSIVKMVMEEPNKAISFLEKAGRNTQDAQKAIQSLRSRYSTWYDIQEQRAYLQQLFHSKIRPNIKNPNDTTEIEEYLSSHPEILDSFPAYKHIQEVRPGSLKDYAKYFSAALGAIPFIFKTPSKDE